VERISERLLNWASILDEQTRAQALQTASMPFVRPHLALMPDAHLGKGATVGSVIPTVGAIIPAAVGVDIGCGMIAVRTQFVVGGLDGLDRAALHRSIERSIPLSAGHYNKTVTATAEKRVASLAEDADTEGWSPADYAHNWELQLGSLGSGNHFVEVTVDELDRVWLFLHSGSRGVGNRIAQRHIKTAVELCGRQSVRLPNRDLAYLAEDTDEFWHYIRELHWAQRFALLNREEMMDRLVASFGSWLGQDVERLESVNCHHNYTEREHHFGEDMWLSRKGAIDAHVGVPGLIPGSMGTTSYVVVGKGEPLSFCSSPHGAGRSYSRTVARKTFTMADLTDRMAKAGVTWRKSAAFLDEHPLAYKDIDQVMADARDLVEVRHTLRQIVNVKGD